MPLRSMFFNLARRRLAGVWEDATCSAPQIFSLVLHGLLERLPVGVLLLGEGLLVLGHDLLLLPLGLIAGGGHEDTVFRVRQRSYRRFAVGAHCPGRAKPCHLGLRTLTIPT